MANLTLPKLLDIPSKLEPFLTEFDKYRIFLLEGGRYGTKSHTVARFLLYLNDKYNLRTVCAREIQNTIKESVHQLLSDLINEYQLNFQVQTTSIKSNNKNSEFLFVGLRDQNRFNIKSFEGADILWIEEGQTLTKDTMDVVLPTIRRPKSKIIVTMNRFQLNDPAYAMLANRPDCLHIKINYTDLEARFLSPEILNEIAICKAQSEKDHTHIYLGEPLEQSDDAVFSLDDIRRGQAGDHAMANGYGIRISGFDVARFGEDKSSEVTIQQMGALHWEEYHVDEWGDRDLNYTTGRILTLSNEAGSDGCVVDEDGIGAGPLDTLRKGRGLDYFYGFHNGPYSEKENREYGNVRTRFAFLTKKMLADGHLNIKDAKLIEELLTAFKYTFDHHQRRILIDKKIMKEKYKIKSPNRADSLIMAVSRIGDIKEKQNRQYEPNMQQYAQDDSLFKIAGVR